MALLDEQSTLLQRLRLSRVTKWTEISTKTFLEKMKCNVGLMIDGDVAEKKNENKVYRDVLNTYDH